MMDFEDICRKYEWDWKGYKYAIGTHLKPGSDKEISTTCSLLLSFQFEASSVRLIVCLLSSHEEISN